MYEVNGKPVPRIARNNNTIKYVQNCKIIKKMQRKIAFCTYQQNAGSSSNWNILCPQLIDIRCYLGTIQVDHQRVQSLGTTNQIYRRWLINVIAEVSCCSQFRNMDNFVCIIDILQVKRQRCLRTIDINCMSPELGSFRTNVPVRLSIGKKRS